MRIDMGAHAFDHARVAVTGDPTPGGVLTVAVTGTVGMDVFLAVGISGVETSIAPFGSVFVDLGSMPRVFAFGTIPNARGFSATCSSSTSRAASARSCRIGRPGARACCTVVAELHGDPDYAWFAATAEDAGFQPCPSGALFCAHPGAVRRDRRRAH